ncbi:trypsin-like peptidase domain-containing protein [Streptomyces sp. NPDC060002]|uniref:trypsin-like peptidase domain-containing protein n=1 Tax=Streptomyces sp. NPDC060002 TaxID=3347033 RepID=UPI003694F0EF
MDDGKPTRAKWWSRPRPQASPGRQSPEDPVDAATAEPAPEETTGREPSTRTEDEGDFELARPARPTPTLDDGDYELSRPAGETAPLTLPAPSAAHAVQEAPEASAVLAAPAFPAFPVAPVAPVASAVPDVRVAPETSAAPGAPVASAAPDVPAAPAASAPPVASAEPGSEGPVGTADAVLSAEVAAAEPPPVADERPKPLHDPDPYSTPPYGEPGPWAPAPPVQHPAATPAPAPAPAAHGAVPAPPAPVGTVPATVEFDDPGTTAAPAPAAYGTVPTTVGRPGTAAASAQPASSVSSAAHAAPAPAVPVSTAPAVPVSTAPAPSAASTAPAPSTPSTAPAPSAVPGASTALAASAGPVVGSVGAQAAVAAADAAPALPADPWHRYDPWSATPVAGAAGPGGPRHGAIVGGPLQYTGAGVLTEVQRRRQVRRRLVGGALAVALVSGGLGGAVGVHLERNGGLDPVELPQAAAEPTGRPADSVAGIAARALPGVVTLHVSGSEEAGTGTGFVLDSLGYILTNNHVVEPAGGDGVITVVFNGGQTAEAEVVGRDSGYDLAVVRVTGVKGLKPLYLGNSDNVRVGDPVVAIGAPFDLEGTVTSGIISAKERPITAGGESGDGSDVSYVDALQTDAPINPGNSGGPLLDAQGHVIGINSAIRSADDGTDSGSAQAGSIGLGFAIPVNQGKRVAEELINTGRATHPVIGVTLDMDYAGDGARVGTADGAAGSPVTAGGPADRAGVRAGDVITEIDGRRVHSGEELIVKTRAHRPGDRLALTIERDGRERTLTLVLGSSGGG